MSEKSERHHPPVAYVAGSIASAAGGSAYVPAPMSGSVRTTGVVFAGMSSIDASTSSGGETWMFQSAPTIVCAASSWLVRTIAR